jgi:phosphoglycolate phosphatase
VRPGGGRKERETKDCLFFDLDGTLTDPMQGITRSIQHALQALGRPVPPAEDLTWCIGPPLLASFETILGDARAAKEALALYRVRFADVGLYENALYDGVAEILGRLRSDGCRLFVATSKPTLYAERIVAHFALDRHVERVFGSEVDGTRSDKTELLRHALSSVACAPRDAVMIGDRSHDMIGAGNNGMSAVGVLYGYGSRDELNASGAGSIAPTVSDIPGAIERAG